MTRPTTRAGTTPSIPRDSEPSPGLSAPRRWIPAALPGWPDLDALLGGSWARELDGRLAASAAPIHPGPARVFRALEATPADRVRVVILGQDPYHGPGQADGLAFSVRPGTAVPPSLRNVLEERRRDLGLSPPGHGDLSAWAREGVLLLNAILTVPEGAPGGHAGWGWERFTDAVLRSVAASARPAVFLLWGRHARKLAGFVDGPGNVRIESAHPSPLSAHRGFFGSACFSRANRALTELGAEPVDWTLRPIAGPGGAQVPAGADS